MIQARIRKTYPAGRDSTGFTLDVELDTTKSVTVLFGPSGAGKTLTLDAIAGFVRPDEGRILLDDQLLFDAAAQVHLRPQQRHCGYVFQNYALFPHMTLRSNLAFAAESWPRLERHRKVTEMLERFRLTEVAGRKPHELSGGQKQRCSIARALVAGPKLLLLDEPARGLDATLRAELYSILRQVRAEFGTPILLVTHSLEECFELADEMLIMQDGAVIQSGAPAKVCEQPASVEVAHLLGIYNILPVEIRGLDPSRNLSMLRYDDQDITGPYYPGRFKGDRVHVIVAPSRLRAVPRNGRPAPNQLLSRLMRHTETPDSARLEFSNGLSVELPRDQFDLNRHVAEWLVEIPPSALRIV
ncbi:MAG TPA: ATP-binding cassette domain-containing protein [Bryobacteraceae bacterium]|nr:ATP-binding cassette domain-containing protein [Bryobacteraceae bacterium]